MAKFYYFENGVVCGPEKLQEIKERFGDVQVCEEGRTKWESMEDANRRENYRDIAIGSIVLAVFSAIACSYGSNKFSSIFLIVAIMMFIIFLYSIIKFGYAENKREKGNSLSSQEDTNIASHDLDTGKPEDSGKTFPTTPDSSEKEDMPIRSDHAENRSSGLSVALTAFGWINIVLGIIAMIVLLIVAKATQSWQTALYALFVLLGAIQPGIIMLALAKLLEKKVTKI